MMQITAILTKDIPTVDKDIERAEAKIEQADKELKEAIKKEEDAEFLYEELEYLKRIYRYLGREKSSLRHEVFQLRRIHGSNTLSKFAFKIDENDDFPRNDGGRVLFKRDHFIKTVARMVLEKKGDYSSHYWRAPPGSGKTVFLKLLGRELASSGCDVYMIYSAAMLDSYDDNYFIELAKQAGDKPVVVLIDDVQTNLFSSQWLYLLKGFKPANLVVLGVGVCTLPDYSPQFFERYPELYDSFPMFFTADDLPEMIEYFAKRFPCHGEHAISEVCQRMLTFTSGHVFPFVKFVNHLLDSTQELNPETIDTYLSSEEFSKSDVYKEVRERCFSDINGSSQSKLFRRRNRFG